MSDEVLRAFKILSSPIKMKIIESLGPEKRLASKELMEEIGGQIYSSLLSNHLKDLKQEGIVGQDERGKYFLTEWGTLLFNVLVSSKGMLLGAHHTRVLHGDMYSEELSSYLTRVLSAVTATSMPHSKRQRLISKLVEKFSGRDEDVVLGDRVLLHVLSDAEEKGWLCRDINYSISLGEEYTADLLVVRERIARSYTISLLRKAGMLDLFSHNIFFLKIFPEGYLSIHLLDPTLDRVKKLSKKAERMFEVVLEYSSPPENILELVELLEKSVPTTIVFNDEESLQSLRGQLPRDALRNTLLVFRGRRLPRDRAAITALTSLINRGFAVLITSSKVFPSQLNFAVRSGEEEVLTASLSVLLPSLYLYRHVYNMEAEEYLREVLGDVTGKIIAERLHAAKHLLGALGMRDPVEFLQVSYVGVEAVLISLMEPYLDLIRDESSRPYASNVLREKVSKFLRTVKEDVGGFPTRHVFFAPLHPFNRAVAAFQSPTGAPLHVHVNMFSPASFATGDVGFLLEKEGKIQSLAPGEALSAAEIRLSARTSAFEVESAVKRLEDAGVKTYTFSLGRLVECLTCGYVSPHLRDVCTRCQSRSLTLLVRPLLRYVKSSSPLIDRYVIEEYGSRPSFSLRRV